ncbi:MAG: FAD-dependent oxidoreductase, partial [Thermocrispum sp.]
MRICNGEGIEIATVPIGDHQYPATRYRYLTRATLRAVLQKEAQRRGIRIHRGKRLIRVATHERGLTAFFSDQTQARGDVLIGADGLHSTVRTLIDPATAAPRYVGQRIFYGYSTNTYWSLTRMTFPDVTAWHRNGMLIIGDAAHAASPATGQGASMALEDAVILAKALRDQPDVEHAFTKYEQLRRERVRANIDASARLSGHADTPRDQPSSSPRTTPLLHCAGGKAAGRSAAPSPASWRPPSTSRPGSPGGWCWPTTRSPKCASWAVCG